MVSQSVGIAIFISSQLKIVLNSFGASRFSETDTHPKLKRARAA